MPGENERDNRLEVLEEMTRSDRAERAYKRACEHWKKCIVCDTAGGEVAARNLLCPVGRMLRDTWQDAEKAYQEFIGLAGAVPESSVRAEDASPTQPSEHAVPTAQDIAPQTSKEEQQ